MTLECLGILLLLGIGSALFISFQIWGTHTSTGHRALENYLEVNVIAHQWWWEFEYEGFHLYDAIKKENLCRTDKWNR